MRIGIDIGGTNIKIGIVDEQNSLIAQTFVKMKKYPADEMIRNIANRTIHLLKVQGISADNCDGIGIGCPGTIDSVSGIVLYSNNISWENVALKKEMERKISLPVFVANDADCAALGEAKAGAARHCKNSVSLTLGTGVGSGVILDGKIFHGSLAGGCELGHTVLIADGEMCTCGRRGCLETYVSARALTRQAQKAAKENPSSIMNLMCEEKDVIMNGVIPFEAAKQGDETANRVIGQYIHYLSEGIANIINIFRPEVVTLGGGIAEQREYLTERVNRKVERLCFAGEHAGIPKVVVSELGNAAGMIGAANLGAVSK